MPARILIAEDEPQVRALVKAALEQAGHDVSAAADGGEALRMLRDARFDVVVTDILMPERDGLETILFLRRTSPGTKIIAMSGSDNRLFLADAAGLGAMRVLIKPFKPSELVQTVRDVLGEGAASPAGAPAA